MSASEPFPGGEAIPAGDRPAGLWVREQARPGPFPLRGPAPRLAANLRLVPGVGPVRAAGLAQRGYQDLESLAAHPRWGRRASEVRAAVQRRDLRALRRLGASDGELLSLLAPAEVCLVDVETLGLTPVRPLFLAGVLCWQGEVMRLRQWLALDLEREGVLLEALRRALDPFTAVVTYNGNRFDLPFLAARLAVHGLAARLPPLRVDLLPYARRRLRGRLPDCRLATVQEGYLGRPRGHDVPGGRVPELYLEYLRTGDLACVEAIFHHNACDLWAAAELLRLLAREVPWEEAP